MLFHGLKFIFLIYFFFLKENLTKKVIWLGSSLLLPAQSQHLSCPVVAQHMSCVFVGFLETM